MEETKYVCGTCASESVGTAGECCGAERKVVCEKCGKAHEEGAVCGVEVSETEGESAE